ncbi:hypothetical protein LXL04_010923 [Taraxacum kok-saghyz]
MCSNKVMRLNDVKTNDDGHNCWFDCFFDNRSFNLGGMGCSAGVIVIDLAKDMLQVYRSFNKTPPEKPASLYQKILWQSSAVH